MELMLGASLVVPISPFAEVSLLLSIAAIVLSVAIPRMFRQRDSARISGRRTAIVLSVSAVMLGALILAARIFNALRVEDHHDYGTAFMIQEVLVAPILIAGFAVASFVFAFTTLNVAAASEPRQVLKRTLKIVFFTGVSIVLALVFGSEIFLYRANQRGKAFREAVVSRLKEFRQSDATATVKLDSRGEYYVFHGSDPSYFEFDDGSWLFVESFSFHYDEVGDLQLAIDDKGGLYEGDTHWCAGGFVEKEKVEEGGVENLATLLGLMPYKE